MFNLKRFVEELSRTEKLGEAFIKKMRWDLVSDILLPNWLPESAAEGGIAWCKRLFDKISDRQSSDEAVATLLFIQEIIGIGVRLYTWFDKTKASEQQKANLEMQITAMNTELNSRVNLFLLYEEIKISLSQNLPQEDKLILFLLAVTCEPGPLSVPVKQYNKFLMSVIEQALPAEALTETQNCKHEFNQILSSSTGCVAEQIQSSMTAMLAAFSLKNQVFLEASNIVLKYLFDTVPYHDSSIKNLMKRCGETQRPDLAKRIVLLYEGWIFQHMYQSHQVDSIAVLRECFDSKMLQHKKMSLDVAELSLLEMKCLSNWAILEDIFVNIFQGDLHRMFASFYVTPIMLESAEDINQAREILAILLQGSAACPRFSAAVQAFIAEQEQHVLVNLQIKSGEETQAEIRKLESRITALESICQRLEERLNAQEAASAQLAAENDRAAMSSPAESARSVSRASSSSASSDDDADEASAAQATPASDKPPVTDMFRHSPQPDNDRDDKRPSRPPSPSTGENRVQCAQS